MRERYPLIEVVYSRFLHPDDEIVRYLKVAVDFKTRHITLKRFGQKPVRVPFYRLLEWIETFEQATASLVNAGKGVR